MCDRMKNNKRLREEDKKRGEERGNNGWRQGADMNEGGQASERPPARVCVCVCACVSVSIGLLFFCSFSPFSEFSDRFDPFY